MPIHDDIIMWMALLNEGQLREYGGLLGKGLGPGAIIALVGELGAGKTTLAKAIAGGLGVREAVTSPTFTLVNEYLSGRLPLYHFDLYRLVGPEAGSVFKELAEIGYEEYFYGEGVTVVEWADRIEGLLPEYTLRIELRYTDNPDIRQVEESANVSGDTEHCDPVGILPRPPGSYYAGSAASHTAGRRGQGDAQAAGRGGHGAPQSTREDVSIGNILAVETTGPFCSVALRTEDGRMLRRASGEGLKHLTSLLPMIEGLLGEGGAALKDLGCIAVSAGPGSFTGIRIGVATVRALAQTLGIPVVKVPTLETFVYLRGQDNTGAENMGANNTGGESAGGEHSSEGPGVYTVACPVFDARRDQIYAGAYMLEADGRIMTLVQGGAYDPGEYFAALGASVEALAVLAKRMAGPDTGIVFRFMGDGVSVCFPGTQGEDLFQTKGDGSCVLQTKGDGSCVLQTKGDGSCVLQTKGDGSCVLQTKGDGSYGTQGDNPSAFLQNKSKQFSNVQRVAAGVVQDAKAVLEWAEAHGVLTGYEELEPIYMRKAEAQRRLDEKNNKTQEPSPFVLRGATEDDAYGISVVERLSFGEPWLEESILSDIRLEYSDYVVCEKEGLVLGYAGLHRILEEGHITNIAVHPCARRKGVGAAVLEELVKRAERQGITEFTLEVREGDEAAIRFYEVQGFVSEGFRKDYYPKDGGRREDARIMWRRRAPADI